jgi:hypothetical protein
MLWQLFRKKQTWGQGPMLWPEHRALHLNTCDGKDPKVLRVEINKSLKKTKQTSVTLPRVAPATWNWCQPPGLFSEHIVFSFGTVICVPHLELFWYRWQIREFNIASNRPTQGKIRNYASIFSFVDTVMSCKSLVATLNRLVTRRILPFPGPKMSMTCHSMLHYMVI